MIDINIDRVLAIVSFVFGFVFGFYQWYDHKKTKKSYISLDFSEISNASSSIARYFKGEKFYPDIIYTFDAKSGILAKRISEYFDKPPLVVTGFIQWVGDKENDIVFGDEYHKVSTNKWKLFIPNLLIDNKDKKILLVDDVVFSGDGLNSIIGCLTSNNVDKSNIRTASFVCTSIAIQRKTNPDYYYKKIEGGDFYFPWGKSR